MSLMEQLSAWAERRLVPGWRESWKWASVQFAAGLSTLIGALIANPDLLLQALTFLPDGRTRAVLVALATIVSFSVPVLMRLWNQEEADGE